MILDGLLSIVIFSLGAAAGSAVTFLGFKLGVFNNDDGTGSGHNVKLA